MLLSATTFGQQEKKFLRGKTGKKSTVWTIKERYQSSKGKILPGVDWFKNGPSVYDVITLFYLAGDKAGWEELLPTKELKKSYEFLTRLPPLNMRQDLGLPPGSWKAEEDEGCDDS